MLISFISLNHYYRYSPSFFYIAILIIYFEIKYLLYFFIHPNILDRCASVYLLISNFIMIRINNSVACGALFHSIATSRVSEQTEHPLKQLLYVAQSRVL